MKVIVAGGRNIVSKYFVWYAIEASGFNVSEVVSGLAKGPDHYGMLWGYHNNIPVKQFPAEWGIHGRSAGFIRNVAMGEHADALVLIWDGKSKGSGHMLDIAREKDLLIDQTVVKETK